MSELISREEAKLAWANGKKLQIANMIVGEDFYDMDDSNTTLNIFDLDFYKFRLKSRTITINGIEVPAPFDGSLKHKQYAYVLNTASPYGYSSMKFYEGGDQPLICWTDEEEIKQVVSALRSVFKGGVI